MTELSLIENLQREDLDPIEEAEGYKTLMDNYQLTQEEAAERVGKSRSAVANSLRLLGLCPEVREMLQNGVLSGGHARALLRLHDEEAQLRVIQIIVSQGLNVKATEDLVERTLTNMYGIADEAEKKKKHSRISGFIRDTRLFVNSIRTIVQQMMDAGLTPRFDADEQESGVDIHIWVPYVHKK